MARGELIEYLNVALSYELAGVIQYMQHSFLVTGEDREVFKAFFRGQANEAHLHAEILGDKIVALGGTPAVEPAIVRQSSDLLEMLNQCLQLEREAMAAYMKAWSACDEVDLPQKFWVEGHIAEEQTHIEELEKLTSDRQARAAR
ncbi:MAG: ferritin-like domain-containing protein [Acidobacteria bacterium]|nr:ferritin-like domain-containing protein [Acidobacteriota bacterium]MBK8149041.1 ferritin-like domain-containing protein [Acidobacteriota bacterium]MBK8811601.1 ferritin-like domain-containing protein [Acidobacteriota bacterium]